jgi:P pilus assembly chaperone PapD
MKRKIKIFNKLLAPLMGVMTFALAPLGQVSAETLQSSDTLTITAEIGDGGSTGCNVSTSILEPVQTGQPVTDITNLRGSVSPNDTVEIDRVEVSIFNKTTSKSWNGTEWVSGNRVYLDTRLVTGQNNAGEDVIMSWETTYSNGSRMFALPQFEAGVTYNFKSVGYASDGSDCVSEDAEIKPGVDITIYDQTSGDLISRVIDPPNGAVYFSISNVYSFSGDAFDSKVNRVDVRLQDVQEFLPGTSDPNPNYQKYWSGSAWVDSELFLPTFTGDLLNGSSVIEWSTSKDNATSFNFPVWQEGFEYNVVSKAFGSDGSVEDISNKYGNNFRFTGSGNSGGSGDLNSTVVFPQDGGVYTSVAGFDGTATGENLSSVEVAIKDNSTGKYYNTATGGFDLDSRNTAFYEVDLNFADNANNAATWTKDGNSTGTASWDMPDFLPGSYNIISRAIGSDNSIEDLTGKGGNSFYIENPSSGDVFTVYPNLVVVPVGAQFSIYAEDGAAPYAYISQSSAIVSTNNCSSVQPQDGVGECVATANSAGSTKIIVSDSSNPQNVRIVDVVVIPATQEALKLIPEFSVITVGSSLEMLALDSGENNPYEWREITDGADFGRFENDQTITGVNTYIAERAGVATVEVQNSDGATDTATIVIVNPGNTLHLNPSFSQISIGGTVQFTASGGSGGYTYSVADSSVGSIDSNGLFTGIDTGCTVVVVEDSTGNTDASVACVTSEGDMNPFYLVPTVAVLPVNSTLQMVTVGGVDPLTWSVSDTSIGTISSTGIFTALSTGNTEVMVRDSSDPSRTRRAFISVVENPNGDHLDITPKFAIISHNETVDFDPIGGTGILTFSVPNTSLGTIDSSTGVFTPSGNGSGFVTVTLADSDGGTATAQVYVYDSSSPPSVPSDKFTVVPGHAIIYQNQEIQFKVVGDPEGAVTWTVENETIAQIDPSTGVLTGLQPGTTLITATDSNGAKSFATITVLDGTMDPVTVTPSVKTIAVDGIFKFNASGGVGPYTWSISNTSTATINPQTGEVRGVTEGTVTITATDSLGQSDSAILIVSNSNTPLILTPVVSTININTSIAINSNASGNVTCVSSDPSIATVVASGSNCIVTASGNTGTVNITVIDSTGRESTAVVTVVNPGNGNGGFIVNQPIVNLVINSNFTITTTNATGNVTCVSSNTNIATVVADGTDCIVTAGNQTGSVTITITDENGNTVTSIVNVVNLGNGNGGFIVNQPIVNLVINSNFTITTTNATGNVTCVSSNTNIATVVADGTDCIVTAGNQTGSVTITITDQDGNVTTSVVNIVNNNGGQGDFVVDQPNVTVVTNSETTLTTTNATGNVTCVSSNTSIATVVADGTDCIVTAGNQTGSVTITITDQDGNTVTSVVTVINGSATDPNAFRVDQPALTVVTNSETTLTTTNATGNVTCVSSNTSIATVVADGTDCIVTTQGQTGTVVVTLTDEDGDTVTSVITVVEPGGGGNNNGNNSFVVNPSQVTINSGTEVSISFSGNNGSVTCVSSDTGVATISSNCTVIIGVSNGSAVITLTDSTGAVATVSVTVIQGNDNDSDNDGISDGDENKYACLNPNDASDANKDTDGDGISNATEIQIGTNPCDPDTDGDGYSDGVEIRAGTDPLNANSKPGTVSTGTPIVILLGSLLATIGLIFAYKRKSKIQAL